MGAEYLSLPDLEYPVPPTPPGAIELIVHDDPVAMPRPRVMLRQGRPHAYVPTHASAAMWRIRQAAAEALGQRPPLLGPVEVLVEVFLHPPASLPKKMRGHAQPTKRPDADNFGKTACDGCSPLWGDDSQIVDLRIVKRYAWNQPPHWRIVVRELAE